MIHLEILYSNVVLGTILYREQFLIPNTVLYCHRPRWPFSQQREVTKLEGGGSRRGMYCQLLWYSFPLMHHVKEDMQGALRVAAVFINETQFTWEEKRLLSPRERETGDRGLLLHERFVYLAVLWWWMEVKWMMEGIRLENEWIICEGRHMNERVGE